MPAWIRDSSNSGALVPAWGNACRCPSARAPLGRMQARLLEPRKQKSPCAHSSARADGARGRGSMCGFAPLGGGHEIGMPPVRFLEIMPFGGERLEIG